MEPRRRRMLASSGYDVPLQQAVQIYAYESSYHEGKSYVLAKGLGRNEAFVGGQMPLSRSKISISITQPTHIQSNSITPKALTGPHEFRSRLVMSYPQVLPKRTVGKRSCGNSRSARLPLKSCKSWSKGRRSLLAEMTLCGQQRATTWNGFVTRV
jgi:hypothetical protein